MTFRSSLMFYQPIWSAYISRISDNDKDLEILVLRYQLEMSGRRLGRTLKPDKGEILTWAMLINSHQSHGRLAKQKAKSFVARRWVGLSTIITGGQPQH